MEMKVTEQEKLDFIENLKECYEEFSKRDRKLEDEFNALMNRLENIAEEAREMRYDFDREFEELVNEFDSWKEQREFLRMNGAENLDDVFFLSLMPLYDSI